MGDELNNSFKDYRLYSNYVLCEYGFAFVSICV